MLVSECCLEINYSKSMLSWNKNINICRGVFCLFVCLCLICFKTCLDPDEPPQVEIIERNGDTMSVKIPHGQSDKGPIT